MAQTTLPPRPLSYEAYCQIPEDGQRYEFLGGEVYVTPAPSSYHQYTSKQLGWVLSQQFDKAESGYVVLFAPIDVILAEAGIAQPDAEIAQPDIVVARLAQVSKRGIEGAPFLLVEVVSPSRPWLDRDVKARRYAAHGVPYYWIADPESEQLDCFSLAGGQYVLEAAGRGNDVVSVPSSSALRIELATLWFPNRSHGR